MGSTAAVEPNGWALASRVGAAGQSRDVRQELALDEDVANAATALNTAAAKQAVFEGATNNVATYANQR